MTERNRKRWPRVLTGLFLAVMLAVHYPLSMGPVGWLYQHGLVPEPILPVGNYLYAPIVRLSVETDFFDTNPVGRAYWRYVQWWDEL